VGRPLSAEDLGTRLRARFGDAVEVSDVFGDAVADVSRETYRDVVTFCRDEPDIACDFCDFTAGVDRGDDGMQVVTHLHSTANRHDVRIRLALPVDDPSIDSIHDLYATCDWHERETAEMFGIRFDGHPRPVKLLLPEPFEGHPLRKDFPLLSREVKPWPGAVEGEEVDDE
jgi:NADH-quinone oxidoreductase subunit C